jgi:hypothetical protein
MRRIILLAIILISFINIYGQISRRAVQAASLPEYTKKIPLGGNSYVRVRGTSEYVSDTGFQAWTSTKSVFSTYFRVNTEGNLRLYLEYSASTGNSNIEVACKDKMFSLALSQLRTGKDTVVYIGTLDKCEVGYIRVDFQGKTRHGKTFAAPSALLVNGEATKDMNYVGDFSYYWGRRGPSVHMGYTIPGGETAEWFYNEVTVPAGFDPVGSYFMANGFNEGYFGMQVNSATERRILFSVWSPANTDDANRIAPEDQVLLMRKGPGVNTGSFGNEGSGGQSYLVYNWTAGNTYKFLNRIRPISDGYTEYTAYFYASETGKWRLIAQWKRPKIQTYYKGAHSFLENFNNTTGHITRKAYYRNQWVYTASGRWVELLNGKFTVDATGRPGWRMDYKGGTEGNGFFLQNCGFFNDYIVPDTPFQREATGTSPDVNWDELE